MIKVSVILKRKSGMSPEEFHRYWHEVHGPLLLKQSALMRHVRKYVQCHSIAGAFAEMPDVVSAQFDGIAELWGDNVDDVKRGLVEPAYVNVIRPDEEKFLDLPNCVFMVTEEIIMGPPRSP
jgi:uncharacterized protein (TIGR02118 family)